MKIAMNDSKLNSIKDVEKFLKNSREIEFYRGERKETYAWIQNTLIKFSFLAINKFAKGIVRQYIIKMTKYSRAQINRLILLYKQTGYVEEMSYERHCFTKQYNDQDMKLLAETDELHGFPNGAALKRTLKFLALDDEDYVSISKVSIPHIYNLRKSSRYLRLTKRYQKTKPSSNKIGQRTKPEPHGAPGYIRVDTVHQGDHRGVKGVYHINTIDEVTQFEFIGAVERITEDMLIPILRQLLDSYPFKVLGFHADNGSEYINKFVVTLLNELLIKLTKSRPRHCNDNALVETKNGSIIRKWIGYSFIDRKYAQDLNKFYFGCFNEYINFHRPCAFASIRIDAKGKAKKVYRPEDYTTPYLKFRSIANARRYLKLGMTFKKLDQILSLRNPNQMARIVNSERDKLFQKICSAS